MVYLIVFIWTELSFWHTKFNASPEYIFLTIYEFQSYFAFILSTDPKGQTEENTHDLMTDINKVSETVETTSRYQKDQNAEVSQWKNA